MKNERPNLKDFVVFLDRTHGRKILPGLLRRVGFIVETHATYFKQEEDDPIWIAECGRRDWIIFSGDKRLERNVENRQAVIDAKCKVFIFADTNSFAEEWASAVIVARYKIHDIIQKYDGPFYVHIGKLAESHITAPRLVGSGGPKPQEGAHQEATPSATLIVPEGQTPEARQGTPYDQNQTDSQTLSLPFEVRSSNRGCASDETGTQENEATGEQTPPTSEGGEG